MSNVRVYELSKDLNKSNNEILNVAKGLGISVKSHASSITEEEAQKIRDRIASSGGAGAPQKSAEEEKEKDKGKGGKDKAGAKESSNKEGKPQAEAKSAPQKSKP